MPGYLGDLAERPSIDSQDADKDREQFLEDMARHARGGETSLADTAGGEPPKSHEKHEASLAETAGGSKEKHNSKRNRSITLIRIGIHGPTKGCHACESGGYQHIKDCRDRFNRLIDETEPAEPKKSPPDEPKEFDEPGDDEYEPSIAGDDLEDSKDIMGLINVAKGPSFEVQTRGLERGNEVVAGILIDSLDRGDHNEESLALKLQTACAALTQPRHVHKPESRSTEWFVEFCCSETSSCGKVCQQLGIPYLGLSREFGDVLDPTVFCQIEYWMHERVQLEEVIHIFGSIPCGPFSPLQNLNLVAQGEQYQDYFQSQRQRSLKMVELFDRLSDVAMISGGSSSFECPKNSPGWKEDMVLNMISRLNMHAGYPTGCGFDLTIDGRKPLKEWRIVSTSKRLAGEMNKYQCKHPLGFRHDELVGGRLAEKSGFYNLKMATAIVSSLCVRSIMNHVPQMPTVKGTIAHEEQGMWLAREVLALVNRPLSREEILRNPKAKEVLMKEAIEMRSMKVWDESKAIEVDELLESCRRNGETIHISEIMPICYEKHSELQPEFRQLRARLVYRGDACRTEKGVKATYREVKSLPAMVHSINIVFFYGMRPGNVVQISDAIKAYLQAPLKTTVPTWAIIPKVVWRDEWHSRFRKVACPLDRALYGHQTAGDDWFDYFDNTLVTKMKGKRIEQFPSVWWFKDWEVLVATYVDDVIAAGPEQGVAKFWETVRSHVSFDDVTVPGRYLGRDHLVVELNKGKKVFMSMPDYARSSYEMYESEFGALKPCETPFVSESLLTTEGYESQGQLAGHAASLLMKLLWLSRLSRPDLSFAITSLAGAICKWSRNHDIQLKRLLGYVKQTCDLGLWGHVPGYHPPTLRVYCDADLAGDPLTCKSHTGILVVLDFQGEATFPVSWCSKRQTAVARSTTEAELASANEAVFQECLPIKTILEEILKTTIETVVHEDNTATIQVIATGYSPKLRSMNRTHRISVAALSEAVERNLIKVEHIESKQQLADLLTKALNKQVFLHLRNLVGLKPRKENVKD